jgi:hypothetical protein
LEENIQVAIARQIRQKKKTRVNSYFLVPVRTSQKQAIELREKDMVEVVLLIVSL